MNYSDVFNNPPTTWNKFKQKYHHSISQIGSVCDDISLRMYVMPSPKNLSAYSDTHPWRTKIIFVQYNQRSPDDPSILTNAQNLFDVAPGTICRPARVKGVHLMQLPLVYAEVNGAIVPRPSICAQFLSSVVSFYSTKVVWVTCDKRSTCNFLRFSGSSKKHHITHHQTLEDLNVLLKKIHKQQKQRISNEFVWRNALGY